MLTLYGSELASELLRDKPSSPEPADHRKGESSFDKSASKLVTHLELSATAPKPEYTLTWFSLGLCKDSITVGWGESALVMKPVELAHIEIVRTSKVESAGGVIFRCLVNKLASAKLTGVTGIFAAVL